LHPDADILFDIEAQYVLSLIGYLIVCWGMLDNILISFDYFIRAYYRVEKVAATDLINLQIMVSI